MPLSELQKSINQWKGRQYYMAMIFRGNDVIKTLNEPFGITEFLWVEKGGTKRRYVVKPEPDIIWNNRDIFLYDFNDACGKELPLDGSVPEKRSIGSRGDPVEFQELIGADIIRGTLQDMNPPEKKSINIPQTLIGVVVIIIIIFVFMGGMGGA